MAVRLRGGSAEGAVPARLVRESFDRLVRLVSGSSLPSHSTQGHIELNSCPLKPGDPAVRTVRFCAVQSLRKSIASTLDAWPDQVTVQDMRDFTLMEHSVD